MEFKQDDSCSVQKSSCFLEIPFFKLSLTKGTLYFNEYLKLKDKDFKRNLDEMDQLKKNSLMHNARGAGRKAKFTDDQVDEIRRLREDGNTIKEIAKRYNCSVGLIHKLINEK